MYRLDISALDNALQVCPSIEEFFQAIPKVDRTPLVAIISEAVAAARQGRRRTQLAGDNTPDGEILHSDDGKNRRGRPLIPAEPCVNLLLYWLYPGTGAPSRLGPLCKDLNRDGGALAKRLGFTTRGPDPKTVKVRFQWLLAHPDLVSEALRAISPVFVQHYLIPPDPAPPPAREERTRGSGAKGKKPTGTLPVEYSLGDDEFDLLVPRGSGADDLLLRHLHGGNVECHRCVPGRCKKGHDHGLTERRPRELKCPNPARHEELEEHDKRCIHEVRREWRCRCCGSNVSVTSGIDGLDGKKILLRKFLRCIHNMIIDGCGVSTVRVARRLNSSGRTSRCSTILDLMHRIRKAMQEPPQLPFRGTVEIDEARVKLRDGVAHLIGAYDHATRRLYIEILDAPATREVMRDFINRVSIPGSRVYTDGTAAWPPGIDRVHGVVIHCDFDFGHGEELYGEGKGRFYITSNRIEGSWGLLKRMLRIHVTVTCKYFPLYLAEEMWKANHIRNRLAAANYEGEERREAALIGELVANMGKRRLNPTELREDVETNSSHIVTGPVISHDSAAPDWEPLDVLEPPLAA